MKPSAVMAPASLERRVAAVAIDLGVAVAIPLVVVSVVTGAAFSVSAAAGTTVNWPAYLTPVLLLASCAGWALVYTAMQGGGGSIGQRVTGLRVADAAAGARIGFGRALARNVVFLLTAAIVVGFFTPLFDRSPRRQGWHDLAAQARVIDVRAGAAVALALGAAAMAPAAASAYGARVNSAPRPGAPAPASGRGVSEPYDDWFGGADPADEATVVVADAPTAVVERVAHPALALAGGGSAPRPAGTALAADDPDAAAASGPAVAPIAPARAGHIPIAVLTWDDGSRMAVYEPTVCGRNPEREPGSVALALRDETLSMSKTHFAIGGDPAGAWIVDRFSTNGTNLVRDGERIGLMPGLPADLRPGDRLEFGDRSALVGGAA